CPISFNVSSSTAVNGSIHFFGILAYATCDGLFTIHSLIKLVVLDYLENIWTIKKYTEAK
ncbi:MAG: hypothetical protein Q8Q81_19880, partial [Oxalobacteraceae bacterium]|nr:hypothetical protein [Oxalobacteraceae bacterium]